MKIIDPNIVAKLKKANLKYRFKKLIYFLDTEPDSEVFFSVMVQFEKELKCIRQTVHLIKIHLIVDEAIKIYKNKKAD